MARKLTPFEKAAKEYERVSKKWQRVHDAYWRKYSNRPYVPLGGSDMTQAQAAATNLSKSSRFGNPVAFAPSVSSFTDVRSLKRTIERMKREISPEAARRRAEALRDNMKAAARSINSPTILGIIGQLSLSQLEDVYNRTDFFERVYDYYKLIGGGEAVDDTEQNLIDLITGALRTSATKKDVKAAEKLAKYLEKVKVIEEKSAFNRSAELEQRRKLVNQGGTRAEIEQRLKSYAVRPQGAPADWYKNYEAWL